MQEVDIIKIDNRIKKIEDKLVRIEELLLDIDETTYQSRLESKKIDKITVSGLLVGIVSVIASVTAISLAVAFELTS